MLNNLTPLIQVKLTISGDRLRDHTTILFDFEQQVFQVNTPIKPGVKKKVKWAVRLND